MLARKKINTRLAFVYYPNGNEMDQMVHNDIACNCIPNIKIAFRYITFHFNCFLRILIAYLRKYAAYLGCCSVKHKVLTFQLRLIESQLTFISIIVGEPKSRIVQKHTFFAPERYMAKIVYTDSLNSD